MYTGSEKYICIIHCGILFPKFYLILASSCFTLSVICSFQTSNLKLSSLTSDHFIISRGFMKAWLDDSLVQYGVDGITQQLNCAEKWKVPGIWAGIAENLGPFYLSSCPYNLSFLYIVPTAEQLNFINESSAARAQGRAIDSVYPICQSCHRVKHRGSRIPSQWESCQRLCGHFWPTHISLNFLYYYDKIKSAC